MSQHPVNEPMSALEYIERNLPRRTRAEAIIHRLTSSSYPHALIGNLTCALARGFGCSEDTLNELATAVRARELELEPTDFLRCIIIQRSDDGVLRLTGKRMKDVKGMERLIDEQDQHEVFFTTLVQLEGDQQLDDGIAVQAANWIAKAFYVARIGFPQYFRQSHYAASLWNQRRRKLDGPKVSHNFEDLKRVSEDTEVSLDEVVRQIAQCLQDPRCHLVLTADTILMPRKQTRFWLKAREDKRQAKSA